jgi:hypothetical protein
MKKLLTLSLALVLTTASIFAQAKKYVLVEHFTNTYCSICASQNPGFYQRIAVETNTKIHHVSIHSSVPYPQCPFYQANKIEQDTRKDFYGLFSTPRVSLNGAALVGAGEISNTNIESAAAGTSPIELKITEPTTTSRTATISFKAVGTVPTGTYRMFAAIVEKKISFAAQNGEATHYNVLRKFVSKTGEDAVNGFDITPTTAMQNISLSYNIAAPINIAEAYLLVWIQNTVTKEVLNSATRFDVQSATAEPSIDAFVNVSPNPTTHKTTVSFTQVTPQYLTVQNAVGQILETLKLANDAPVELDLSNYATGILFIKVQSEEGVALKKIVRN